jgi:lauroyl/myristoyl acyltransferase
VSSTTLPQPAEQVSGRGGDNARTSTDELTVASGRPAARATVAQSPPRSVRARAGRFWTRLLSSVGGRSPGLAITVSPFFLWFAWNCSRYSRLALRANARRILGPDAPARECDRLAKATLANFFRFVADMGRNNGRSVEQILTDIDAVEGLENYRVARVAKRGAILAAAHIGPFECAVASLRRHEPKVHVVFRRDMRNDAFESLRASLRAKLGVIEAPVDDAGGLGPWMALREALGRDEVVLLHADRVMPGQRGALVPFLGGHIELPPGPVKLALASGAPILPVFSFWQPDGRVRIVIEPAIEVTEPWTRDRAHPAQLQLAGIIEQQIRRHPDQWLMFHPALIEDQDPR